MSEIERPVLERALAVIEALPGTYRVADDAPLRDNLPGIWPTVGDLRASVAERSAMLSALKVMDEALTRDWGQPDDDLTRARFGDEATVAWKGIRSAISEADGR